MNESKILRNTDLGVINKLYPVIKNWQFQNSDQKAELSKLDRIDFNVAAWIYLKHPRALYSYLEYIAPEYRANDIELNIQAIYSELLAVFEPLNENVY